MSAKPKSLLYTSLNNISLYPIPFYFCVCVSIFLYSLLKKKEVLNSYFTGRQGDKKVIELSFCDYRNY